MPEHDLADLDAAFAALGRDITSTSRAPGAARAVSAAHHRRRSRRTAIGVTTVAVLALGALAAGHGLAGDTVGPADGLPDPRPIDAASLSDATTGWTPAWENTGASKEELVTAGVPTDRLGAVVGAATPEPALPGEDGLLAGQAVAFINVADFGQDDASANDAWRAYSSGAASCAHGRETVDDTSGSAQVIRYTISPDEAPATQYIWLVRVNDQIGVALIANAATPMANDVEDRVTNAMLAGVLSPGSYTAASNDKTAGTAKPSSPTTSSNWALRERGPFLRVHIRSRMPGSRRDRYFWPHGRGPCAAPNARMLTPGFGTTRFTPVFSTPSSSRLCHGLPENAVPSVAASA